MSGPACADCGCPLESTVHSCAPIPIPDPFKEERLIRAFAAMLAEADPRTDDPGLRAEHFAKVGLAAIQEPA